MLSDCFNNYIGLRGYCEDTTPESGMYINDLSGISLNMLASLSNDEQKNYIGIWDEIYTRSLHELEGEVLVKMQKYFNTNILIDNSYTGIYEDPYVTAASSNELKGSTIEMRDSVYTSIFINHVDLYLNSATDGNIFVYNLMNGKLLDTIAFTGGVEGINTIQINKSYNTLGQYTKIFICYDSNIADSIKTNSIDVSHVITRGARIAIGDTVLKNNLTFDGSSYGLVVNFNIKCEISEFICRSKDLFKLPLLYKLASNIMLERMTSTRINKFTMNSLEKAEDIMEFYKEKYKKLIDATLNNLEASSDRVCFSCNKSRIYAYLKP
jgi:hypothetical protein